MQVKATRKLPGSCAEVFAVLSDFANAPHRIGAIKRCEVLTPGPVAQGTRFRETRIMFGKEATETMEVVEWNPPSHYTIECTSCGCLYRSTVSCKPDGDGTIVEMSFAAMPLSFMAKLLSPLGKLMMGTCRKAFEKDLDDLQRSLSGPAGQPA